MSKWNKLIVHICNLSKDLRFDVELVRQIVESEAKNDEDSE